MRIAEATLFQQLLRLFAGQVVEPLLKALSRGALIATPSDGDAAGATSILLDKGPKSKPFWHQIDLDFWRRNGAQIIAEYASWKTWLQRSPLSATFPACTFAGHDQVKTVFVDGFYDIGLGTPEIWLSLCGESLSRSELCQKFLADVEHSVCCYCDIETVRTQYYFDHFIPRSLSPYIAVAARNLYVICSSCNSSQVGKGQKVVLPVELPCHAQIGAQLRFSFSEEGTNLEARRDANLVESHLALLQLRRRYASPIVTRDILGRAARVYESVVRSALPFSLGTLTTYFDGYHGKEPLRYACRAALVDQYAEAIEPG